MTDKFVYYAILPSLGRTDSKVLFKAAAADEGASFTLLQLLPATGALDDDRTSCQLVRFHRPARFRGDISYRAFNWRCYYAAAALTAVAVPFRRHEGAGAQMIYQPLMAVISLILRQDDAARTRAGECAAISAYNTPSESRRRKNGMPPSAGQDGNINKMTSQVSRRKRKKYRCCAHQWNTIRSASTVLPTSSVSQNEDMSAHGSATPPPPPSSSASR